MDTFVQGELPDWNLIDEISVPLIEKGISTFDVLQAVLPSLLAVDALNPETSPQRLNKLFRISQLHIEYLLRSQSDLLQRLEKTDAELKEKRRELKTIKHDADWQAPMYKCVACGKIFLAQSFLVEHLQRRHGQDNANKDF